MSKFPTLQEHALRIISELTKLKFEYRDVCQERDRYKKALESINSTISSRVDGRNLCDIPISLLRVLRIVKEALKEVGGE